MVCPSALTLLLDRLFRGEEGSERNNPEFDNRVAIYLEALEYVKKNPTLLGHVLGHRNLVTHTRDCMEVDLPLLDVMRAHPEHIPNDFVERLPKRSSLVPFVQAIYDAHRGCGSIAAE